MKKIIIRLSILSSIISGVIQSSHDADRALQKILPVKTIQQLVLGYSYAHGENFSQISDSRWNLLVSFNDNSYTAYSSDERIHIWQQRRLFDWIKLLEQNGTFISSALYSFDGACLAVGSCANTIKIWQIKNNRWECIQTFEAHKNAIASVAISAHGNYIVSASVDKEIKIWKLQGDNWECKYTFKDQDFAWGLLAISPQGDSIAFSSIINNKTTIGQLSDNNIWKWETASADGNITSIIYSLDSKTIFTLPDPSFRQIYTYTNNKWSRFVPVCKGSLPFRDAYIVTGSMNWNIESNSSEPLQSLVIPHRYELNQDIFDTLKQSLPPVIQQLVNNYMSDKWEKFQTLTQHSESWQSLFFVAISSDDKYIFFLKNFTISIWQLNKKHIWEPMQEIKLNDVPNFILYSPCGNYIMCGMMSKICIWQLKNESYELVQTIDEKRVEAIGVSSNGMHMVTKAYNTIKRWRFKNEKWEYADIIAAHQDFVIEMMISPDGNQIAVSSNRSHESIALYEFKDNSWPCKFGFINSGSCRHGKACRNFCRKAVCPDCFTWDFRNNKREIFSYEKHTDKADNDAHAMKILCLDGNEYKHIDTIREHERIGKVAISESGNYIVSFTEGYIVNVWKNVKTLLSSPQADKK